MDAVARPGAFAANFTPDVLNRFRDLCKQQGKQYTKVLQLLAELYLDTTAEAVVLARYVSGRSWHGRFACRL